MEREFSGEMIRLSERLQAVANLAGKAGIAADVGTDHGYIPIFLVSAGKAERAIAMDVNEGPLLRAWENIRQFHLEEQIETRLSDGLTALQPGEVQVIVAAGMGGALMSRILEEGEAAAHMAERLVLQPQSELPAFRQFLIERGYRITAEDMVYEDGKFYSMMAVKWMGDKEENPQEEISGISLKYGPLLLAGRHPVLQQYLRYQREQKRKILKSLEENARQDAAERKSQVARELAEIEELL